LAIGAVWTGGAGANPTIDNFTMTGGRYGAYINTDGTFTECDLDDTNTEHLFYLVDNNANLDLDGWIDGGYNGYNNIVPDTSNNKKAIYQNQTTPVSIDARGNWWGTSSPPTSLFSHPNSVNYTNPLASANPYAGASKVVPVVPSAYDLATLYERDGLHEKAYDAYYTAVAESDDEVIKRRSIKKMIYLSDHIGKDYSDVRSVIEQEMLKASPEYGVILDFLTTDLRFLNGDNTGAVNELIQKADLYRGTWMECEMLTFAAVISGDCLGNKEQARSLADKAAAINPGYCTLNVAYHAAGMKYRPNEHTDVFANGSGAIEKKVTPLEDPLTEETLTPSVAIFPNPANPATTISYTIAKSARVTLDIYSVNGQKVATLVDRNMPAGLHSVVFDGSSLASGVYFYRLETPGFAKTGKMLLVK